MVIDTHKIGNLTTNLEKYKNTGYRIAKNFSNDYSIEASTASMMLLNDFE